jgi:hypothetical protein
MLKWIEALESGNYQQIQGHLRMPKEENGTPARYCCLGVACEVAIKEGAYKAEPFGAVGYINDKGDDHYGTLPKEVVEWLGVLNENPPILIPSKYRLDGRQALYEMPGSTQASCVLVNDRGYTFQQIAKMLRETYLV